MRLVKSGGDTARSVSVLTSCSPPISQYMHVQRPTASQFPLAHRISVMPGGVREVEKLPSFSCSLSLGWEALEPGAKVGRQANLLSGVCPSWWFPTVGGGQAEPSFSKLWFPCVPNDHNSFLKHVGEDTAGNIPNAPRKCLERSRNPTPAPPHPFPTSLRSWF